LRESSSTSVIEKRKKKPKAVDFFDRKPTPQIATENSIRQQILQQSQNVSTLLPPQTPIPSTEPPQIPSIFGKIESEDLYPELEWSSESSSSFSDESDVTPQTQIAEIQKAEKEKTTSRHDDKKKKKHKKHKHRKKEKKAKAKEVVKYEDGKLDTRKPSTAWLSDVMERPYYFDEKGDKNNIQFGHLYRLDIPSYRRSRFILGLPPDVIIHFNKENTFFTLIDLSDSASSSELRYWRVTKREKRQRELDLTKVRPKSRKKFQELTQQHDYIALEGFESSDDEEKIAQSIEDYLTKKAEEYNKKTRDDKNNVKLWIEFINFQDEYMKLGGEALGPILEKKISIYQNAIKANPASEELLLGYLACCEQLWETEKVLKVWQKTVFDHPDSPGLWKAYLAFFQSNFSSFTMSALRTLYGQAIKILLKSKGLYTIGTAKHRALEERALLIALTYCSVERQAGYAERALAVLQALLEVNFKCPPKLQPQTLTREAFHSFFQAFWDSEVPRIGEENAEGWASWHAKVEEKRKNTQIVADYDPSKPTVDEDDIEEKSAKEGEKSESHSIRSEEISVEDNNRDKSEPSAEQAPTATTKTSNKAEDSATKSDEMKKSLLVDWLQKELRYDREKWLPCKNLETDPKLLQLIEEDPESVVLFEDVKDFVIPLSYDDLKLELFYRTLEFLGLCLPPRYASSSEFHKDKIELQCDERPETIERLFSLLRDLHYFEQSLDVIEEPMTIDSTVQHIRPIQPKLNYDWWNEVMNMSVINDPKKQQFIRRLFVKVAPYFATYKEFAEQIAVFHLFFEASQNMDNARELAKKMLKVDRHNLSLWNAYALIERKSGNLNEARRVYDTALTLSPQLPPAVKIFLPVLVKAYSTMELFLSPEDDRIPKVINILLSLPEGSYSPLSTQPKKGQTTAKSIAPTRIMKGRKGFETQFEQKRKEITAKEIPYDVFIDFVVCYAYFEYLTNQNLERIIHIFDIALPLCKKTPFQYERLLTEKVAFTYLYNQTHPIPPRYLRDVLSKALSEFPRNPVFLSLFIASESRSHITGRLRRYFDEVAPKESSVVVWLFAINSENRPGATSRNLNLFERALSKDSTTRRSVNLWRSYLEYALKYAKNKHNTKGIYFRAIRNVPWSKRMWLTAIELLLEHFTLKELMEIIQLMNEKEIRFHTPPPVNVGPCLLHAVCALWEERL